MITFGENRCALILHGKVWSSNKVEVKISEREIHESFDNSERDKIIQQCTKHRN